MKSSIVYRVDLGRVPVLAKASWLPLMLCLELLRKGCCVSQGWLLCVAGLDSFGRGPGQGEWVGPESDLMGMPVLGEQ